MKTPVHVLTITVVVLVFAWLMIERAKADVNPYTMDLFPSKGEPEPSVNKSFYKQDGSLVNIYNAKDAGIVVKDGEVEYYAVPKDNGEATFIFDDKLLICTDTGCY
jgi:ABC-type thiamine transport system substrate-binding protein|tara:strand:+ start:1240 stop:1557 length:318 start_codon:yes stop_codon:yes gene_type:complete